MKFYVEQLGLFLLSDPNDFDGAETGLDIGEPHFGIWDENNWGKSNEGPVTFAFYCDDHEDLSGPDGTRRNTRTAQNRVWGGKELTLKDPDGNIILIL